ncbi:hypothetical protein EDF18_0981 [Frigoribacterium sp. PhB107]|uniref:hypothetical protein n=1 Tax=Frigoribacterium sp. PhB107 TaxID=2485172 RepID=UPI000F9B667E|nr:hypothetical protein [Frigoribacterium sp. PhB107]ROP78335.1 hypothetical protein EDF18_0981 [Frigoribacterium sp. PhB107]
MDTTQPAASVLEILVGDTPVIVADDVDEVPAAFAEPLIDGEDASTALDTEGV